MLPRHRHVSLSALILSAALLAFAAAPTASANTYASAENGKIAFTGVAGNSSVVSLVSPDDGAVRRVTVSGAKGSLIYGALLDPTGRRIAFSSRRPGPVCTPVPNEPPFCQPIDETLMTSVKGGRGRVIAEGLPTDFSPDGKRILSLDGGTIWSTRLDGKGVRAVGAGFDAVISASGDAIAVDGISLMRADGTGRVPLTSPPSDSYDHSPTFSPDGLRVAFVRTQPGPTDAPLSQDIYSVGVDGTDLRNLTPAYDLPAGDPEYSPDGEMIAFHGGASHFSPDTLYLMKSDGSGLRPLIQSPALVKSISWAPAFRCAGKAATIVGDDGPDRITGTRRVDVIVGNAGSDTIDGRGGKDRICGGHGNDKLRGGAARDKLVGGPGRDSSSQ